jgi:hypothetical protein
LTATSRASFPKSALPARPSLEHLRKKAKQRLVKLRASGASARLADAQLLVAREYGFPSWRALKAAVERGNQPIPDSRPSLNYYRVASPVAVLDSRRAENAFFSSIAMALLLTCMATAYDLSKQIDESAAPMLVNVDIAD